MIDQLFLDMDGVIADFIGAAIEFYGMNCTHEDIVSWDSIFDYFDGDKEMFWRNLPEQFWSDWIRMTPEAYQILKLVEPYKPTLLTCPGLYSGCTGKQQWIRQYLPEYYKDRRYLIGPGKDVIARPGAVLIDDGEHNVEAWEANGGQTILVPRPWNSGTGDPIMVITHQLMYYSQHDPKGESLC